MEVSSAPTLLERSVAAIGYLGIFCLVPLLLHRGSPFAMHHGKQGFVILLTWVLLWIGAIVPIIGAIVWFFGSIGLLLLILFGMVQALYGNLWEIPILGAYAKKLDFQTSNMPSFNELFRDLTRLRERTQRTRGFFDLDATRLELEKLRAQMNEPGFWGDANRARTVGKKAADLEKELVAWDSIEKELDELETLGHMAEEEGDETEEVRIREASTILEKTFSTLEFSTLFSGPYDAYSAIVTIQAGSGGTEAMDWAAMLMRMYLRFAEAKEWGIEILDESRGEEVGYKSITLEVDGRHAYGFLRSEAGVHRLVRISPFDAEQMRHTTFAQVEVLPDIPADESEIEIPADDLRIDTYMSGGKGGQSVNTTYSAVRIVHLPTSIVVTCQSERSQQQNRETAMRVLIGKLVARKELERLAERAKLRGEYQSAEWGNQIRSYVLHPYKLVKDHRTEHETSDAEAVLNGALEPFMEAYLRKEVEESRA